MTQMPGGGAPVPGVNFSGSGVSTSTMQGIMAASSGSGTFIDPDNPPVYKGKKTALPTVDGKPYWYGGTTKDEDLSTVTDEMKEFDSWSLKRKRRMAMRLARAGYFGKPPKGVTLREFVADIPMQEVEAAYGTVVQESAGKYLNGIKQTPDEILESRARYLEGAQKAAGSSWWGKDKDEKDPYAGKTITTTNNTIDIFSPEDARGLARSVVERELGRAPTEEEYADFVSALQAEQEGNPAKTTTATTYDKHGRVKDTSSVTTGGITESGYQAFAEDWAQEQPGWAEWQAIGTYLPAVLSALGASD